MRPSALTATNPYCQNLLRHRNHNTGEYYEN
jgi:hypothetical protein